MTDKVSYALDFLQEFDSVSWYQKELGIVLDYIIELEDLVKFLKTLNQEPVLDKIRAEIEKAVWEDVIVSLDGADEVRIPRLNPDDVFEIIDKYKAESEDKE